jgi:hypothetical protein
MVPIGFDPIGTPFGFRLDGQFGQFGTKNDFYGTLSPDKPEYFSIAADLKLRLPTVTRYLKRANFYLIGGGNWFDVKNMTLATSGTTVASPSGVLIGTTNWDSQWGWNAGGGFQFGWGRSNVFVESRYQSFSNGGFNAGHVPITLGLSWF